jgi:hypothetical protein
VSRSIRLLLGLLALGVLGLTAGPVPALPEGTRTPELPAPITPISVDELGGSPGGDFDVFQVGSQIRFQRTSDDEITFVQTVIDVAAVGFDPADRRAFILERVGPNATRFRMADPDAGDLLFDRVMSGTPAVLTNADATVNVLLESLANGRTRAFVLRDTGRVVHQRTMPAESGVAFNLFDPVVVFTEPQADGSTRLDAINSRRGALRQRETLVSGDVVGMPPDRPELVISRITGPNSFRVKLTDAVSGRILLNRNFTGPQALGFSPSGDLLAVDAVVASITRTLFFRTDNGRQVF